MGTRQILVVAVAVAGGLFLAACSDDAEALSKSEFIEQADAICEASTAEQDPVWEEFWMEYGDMDWDDPAVQDELYAGMADMFATVAPIMKQQIDDLDELVPPEADAEKLETMLDELDAAVDEAVEITAAAAAGDEAARAQMDSDDDPFADVNHDAQQYGMRECGSDE